MEHDQPAQSLVANPTLYPLTFTPALRDYVWGGRNLERLYGRPLPPGQIAESWEISAHPTASTVVDAGPLRGRSLPEVLAIYGTKLVGKRSSWAPERGRFPLLVKLLDVERRLSVQVHPPDDYALQHENGELGKTEMWYVLHAQPGARIILGLRSGVTPGTLQLAAAENRIEEELHFLPVRVGDAIFIPPGTIHAALEGLVINEVLQNSDTTYRLYDWDRLGSDGKPRPLHMNKAMEVMDFQRAQPGPVQQVVLEDGRGLVRTRIVSCRYFVVEKIALEGGAEWQGHANGETFEMWGTIQGQADLSSATGDTSLPAVKYCLVPAALGDFAIRSQRGATLLRIYLPSQDTA